MSAYEQIAVAMILLGAFAWLIRLESKVLYLDKDHTNHKTETAKSFEGITTKYDDLSKQLNQIAQSLAKIECFLYSANSKKE